MKSILKLERVEASLTGRVHGLHDISLELPQAGIGLLLGGPHSGKSSLMELIAGEILPNGGRIEHKSFDVTNRPVWYRRQKGLVLASQKPPRFDLLTAEEQICLGLRRTRLPVKHKQLLMDHIPEIGPLLTTPMRQLSRQAHRLVDIASCLVKLPSVMLIDEPGVDFGPERAKSLALSLRSADIALLIADRYALPMLEIADHGWLFSKGRIVEQGSPASLAANDRLLAVCLGDEV